MRVLGEIPCRKFFNPSEFFERIPLRTSRGIPQGISKSILGRIPFETPKEYHSQNPSRNSREGSLGTIPSGFPGETRCEELEIKLREVLG